MKRALVVGTALLAMVGAAGCGENVTSPTTTLAPFVGQFSGTWSGSFLTTDVSGGECVGADLRASGTSFDQSTINVTQKNTDVTAIVRSVTTGLTCRYDGTASLTTFALSAVSCDEKVLFQCSNGASRVLRPVGSTMTATQTGERASGILTTRWNIFSADLQGEEKPVAGMTIQEQFTAIRR